MLRTMVLAFALTAATAFAAPRDSSRSGRSFYEHSVAVGFHRLENGALRRGTFRSEPQIMDAVNWIAGD